MDIFQKELNKDADILKWKVLCKCELMESPYISTAKVALG